MTVPLYRVPPGRYDLTVALDDRARALCGAPPRGKNGLAHPVFAYLGALGGLSMPIGDLSRSLGLAFDAGPVLGRCELSYPGRLEAGHSYDVLAEVVSITRKPSRRFGRADHALLAITLARHGNPVSVLRLAMITPARASAMEV